MKKIIISFAIVMVLLTSVNFASNTIADVYLNEFNLKVNGDDYTPSLPLLNYEGRTYIPLSNVAELSKLQLRFESPNIFITNQTPEVFYLYETMNTLKNCIVSISENSIWLNISQDLHQDAMTDVLLDIISDEISTLQSILSEKSWFSAVATVTGISNSTDINNVFYNLGNYITAINIVYTNAKYGVSLSPNTSENIAADSRAIINSINKVSDEAYYWLNSR